MPRSTHRRREIRKKIREATERRKKPDSGPSPSGSIPEAILVPEGRPEPEPIGTIACLCGKPLTIFRRDDKKQIHCASCERGIKIGIVADPHSGKNEVIPIYPPEEAPSASDVRDSFPTPAPRIETPSAVGMPSPEVFSESTGLTPVPELVPMDVPLPVLPQAEPPPPPPPPRPEPPKPEKQPVPPPPKSETAKSADRPGPPAALPFKCVCGRGLVAKRSSYGGRIRCHPCGTWLAIEPSFDEARKVWEIRATPSSEPRAPIDPAAG